MIAQDVLDDIINAMDPTLIEPDFIIMAKVTGFDGKKYVLSGDELRAFMKNPREFASEARIIPDVRKIREAIINRVNVIYDQVNDRFNEDFG